MYGPGPVPRGLLRPSSIPKPSKEPYQVRCHPKGYRSKYPGGSALPDHPVFTPQTPSVWPSRKGELSGGVRVLGGPQSTL